MGPMAGNGDPGYPRASRGSRIDAEGRRYCRGAAEPGRASDICRRRRERGGETISDDPGLKNEREMLQRLRLL